MAHDLWVKSEPQPLAATAAARPHTHSLCVSGPHSSARTVSSGPALCCLSLHAGTGSVRRGRQRVQCTSSVTAAGRRTYLCQVPPGTCPRCNRAPLKHHDWMIESAAAGQLGSVARDSHGISQWEQQPPRDRHRPMAAPTRNSRGRRRRRRPPRGRVETT